MSIAVVPARTANVRRQSERNDAAASRGSPCSDAVDGHEGDSSTKWALVLLMLTAVRPGELRGARWDEVDERAALWRIPASRMKMNAEHAVPLSKQAVRALAMMRKLSGDSALVFPSPFYPGKPLSDGTLNSALARLGYKGTAMAHGFRTPFSTCANEAGWNSDVSSRTDRRTPEQGITCSRT